MKTKLFIFSIALIILARCSNDNLVDYPEQPTDPSGKTEAVVDLFNDIVYTEEQKTLLFEENDSPSTKGAVESAVKLWPDGIVYFKFHSNYTNVEKNAVLAAMSMIAKYTPIQFEEVGDPYNYKSDYVYIHKTEDKNDSYLGKIGGAQVLNLQKSVLASYSYNRTTIVHELLHAVGLIHEHQRPDRDTYVTLDMNAIRQNNTSNQIRVNYDKYSSSAVRTYTAYDTQSIMHYSSYITIKATNTQPPGTSSNFMDDTYILSRGDVQAICELYRSMTSRTAPRAYPNSNARLSNDAYGIGQRVDVELPFKNIEGVSSKPNGPNVLICGSYRLFVNGSSQLIQNGQFLAPLNDTQIRVVYPDYSMTYPSVSPYLQSSSGNTHTYILVYNCRTNLQILGVTEFECEKIGGNLTLSYNRTNTARPIITATVGRSSDGSPGLFRVRAKHGGQWGSWDAVTAVRPM